VKHSKRYLATNKLQKKFTSTGNTQKRTTHKCAKWNRKHKLSGVSDFDQSG